MKILMLKGLPGSGKSTWAKQMSRNNQQYVRVNKDDLREMIGYTPHRESLVLRIRDAVIVEGLNKGKHVIVDDTNFHPKHEARLRELAVQYKAEFEEKFFDTPLNECIVNDLKRLNSVGEKVIRKMHREFLSPKIQKPEFDLSLPIAIICDLDGTLSLHNGRDPYDASTCDEDLVNWDVAEILWMYLNKRYESNKKMNVIFVSGREEKYREKTMAFLLKAGIPIVDGLFMRPTGDFRKDDIVKQEIYDRELKGKYNVRVVFDDRNRVVDMWRRNGLTCFQVAEGDF